jgi:transposase
MDVITPSKPPASVSVLTLAGRLILPYQGYTRHVAWLQQGAEFGGAKLWYERARKRFYLLVSLTIKTAAPTPATLSQVLGIDLGQRYLATVTTPENHTQFYTGKQVRATADHYARLQKRLQRKGTRSATRRRIAVGQRERRFQLSTNHTIAKHILDTHPHSLIGLEDLTGIRERTRRRKKRRKGKQLVPVSPKARKANRHASRWAFAELRDC